MKMFKLMGKRGFAVFTALALCAGLVAPSFAATIWDLQYVINGTYEGDAFTVTNDENGRTIKLNEDVVRDVDNNDATGAVGFVSAAGTNLTLDLNGYNIDSKGGGALNVNSTVNLTIKDSTAHTDEDGTYVSGKITGSTDSGVKINGGGSVTLESGTITGNTSGQYGGGVYVTNGAFTMTGGEISGNTAGSSGGGVGVSGAGSSFTMTDGTISGNTAANAGGDSGGGGVWIKNKAEFTMDGGKITENKVEKDGGNGGGVAIHQATFTMTDGEISNNESSRGTGVLINANSKDKGDASFTMTGGYVAGEDGKSCIYLEESDEYDATFQLSGDAVMDGSIRLGKGTQVITNNVTQPGGLHKYTGFDMMADEKGSDKLTDENGETLTIKPDQTEEDKTDGAGYTADQETFLDVHYDHVWGSAWSSNGVTTHSHSCIHCSVKDPDPSHAQEHTWDAGVTVESTCTSAGATIYTCTGCGETKTVAATDGLADHKWDDGKTTLATCTNAGATVYTCKVCGVTKEESIPALNHKLADGVDAVSGEWGSDEDSHWHTCTLCGKEVFSNGAHNWDNGVVTTEATAEADGEMTYTCTDCRVTKTEPIPFTETPEIPDVTIDDPIVPLAPLPDEVEIDDPEVPLAGLLTRADVIGYLWEETGSPDAELSTFEDVPEDHRWAVAIGWAQDVGIAVADVDGNFRPDDLILRSVEDIELSPEGELEQFLNRYAVFAGIKLEEGELFIMLDGDPDDIIMGEDAQIIFDDFFARLELALAQAS
ncbi:MAG: hypothetical protein HDT33_05945 [Clostridiales bacterium]|nr:hypothetical protein [Clostridiales bacterium]